MIRKLFALFAPVLLTIVGSQVAQSQLVDNDDGTITDTKTGLIWLQDASLVGTTMTHGDATAAVAGTWAQQTGWRLPSDSFENSTLGEFGTLFWNYGISAPGGSPFVNISHTDYWTSNLGTCAEGPCAVAYDADDPSLNSHPTTDLLGAWPVRDAPGGPNPVPTDVWIRDCWYDRGGEPSNPPCGDPLKSPDIYISTNDIYGHITEPRYGLEDTIWAIVRNASDAYIRADLRVLFYRWNCTSGSIVPGQDATYIGRDTLPLMAPGAYEYAQIVHTIPVPPDSGEWCFGAVVHQIDDPANSPAETLDSNNIAATSMSFILSRKGRSPLDKSIWIPGRGWVWLSLTAVLLAIVLGYVMARRFDQTP